VILVLSTVPNRRVAQRMAKTLVKEKLTACVNIIPGIESHYVWQGKMEKSRELLLLMKSTPARYTALEKRIKTLHPYSVPEIIAFPISKGSAPYLKWLNDSVRN
jgi:periplasmic divalent cation tolerance protein